MRTAERDSLICRLHDEGLSLAQIAERLAAERDDWAISVGQISRVLAQRGRRKYAIRRDAGRSRRARITAEQEAALVSIVFGLSRSGAAPGKPRVTRLSTQHAIREAEHQGLIPRGAVTTGWLNRRLRSTWNIHRRGPEARRSGPAVVRRFEARRAGALYQFDATLARSFYLDASGDFIYMPSTELKEQMKVAGRTRAYVLAVIDDYSRAVRLAAYDGETARNVIAFLRGVFTRSDDPSRPFCGLPTRVYADNGSGLNSALARRALETIGVARCTHRPRAAWGKGKIEARFRATESFQELTRGRRIGSFTQFNEFLRQVELELNNRIHSETGERPLDRFLRSAGERAAAGLWSYAPSGDDFWRRLAMMRIDAALVRADLTISLGDGERLALPHARPYVDWIGKRIAALVDTPPGASAPIADDERCIVVAPDGRSEWEIPRRRPESARSLVGADPVKTSAADLIERARHSSAGDREPGGWIGEGARVAAAVRGDEIRIERAAAAPEAMIDRHRVVATLYDLSLYDPTSADDRALIEDLMQGREAIERSRLDHLIDHGRLPEDSAEEDAA